MRFKLDFSQKLLDLEGRPMRLGTQPEVVDAINAASKALDAVDRTILGAELDKFFGREETLRSITITSLQAIHEDEKKLGDDERIRRFELCRRIMKTDVVIFNTTERDLFKMLVGKTFRGILIAPIYWEMIEMAEKIESE